MNYNRRKESNLSLALVMLAGGAGAVPRELPGNIGLKRLFSQSDLVILGRVEEVRDSGEMTATARIDVEKKYKGDVPGTVVVVSFDGTSAHCSRPLQSEYALFFLKSIGDKKTLADCLDGKLPVVFEVPGPEAGEAPEDALSKDLVKGLNEKDKTKRVAAIQQLVGLERRDSIQKIKSLANSDDPETKFTAHWALLKLGDYGELPNLAKDLHKSTPISTPLRWNLANAIENVRDKGSAKSIIRLTSSDDSTIVEASVRALRNVRSPGAAARLVELLDSPDKDIAYNAMAALDVIANGEPTDLPSLSLFSKDPNRYIAHWKDWWAATGKKKFGK